MLYTKLTEQITSVLKEPKVDGAIQDRAARLTALRGLKAAIDLEFKDLSSVSDRAGSVPSDNLVELVMVRELKKRQDSMEQYSKVGAVQLYATELAEAALIKTFLPQQLEKAEVEAKIDEVIARVGTSIGPIMKEMKAWAGARFPGKELSDLVKSKL